MSKTYPKLLNQCSLKPGDTLIVSKEYTGGKVAAGSQLKIVNLVTTAYEHPSFDYKLDGMNYIEGETISQVIYECEGGTIIWPCETENGYREVE
jgi:hypothetical protein